MGHHKNDLCRMRLANVQGGVLPDPDLAHRLELPQRAGFAHLAGLDEVLETENQTKYFKKKIGSKKEILKKIIQFFVLSNWMNGKI